MDSPCSTVSSPTLTMAVTSAGGTVRTIPVSRRAAPTPPARTATPLMSGDSLEPSLEQRHVGVDHEVDQFGEGGLRLPPQLLPGLGGIAHEQVDLGRPEEALVHHHVAVPVEPHPLERQLAELAHRMGLARGHHV